MAVFSTMLRACPLFVVVFLMSLVSLLPESAHAKTIYLTTLNAERGDIGAQYELGIRYFYGRDVERDAERGLEWLEKAAENQSVRALNQLAFLYLNGVGVRKNEKKAFEYYKKSAHEGSTDGQFSLGFLYKNGVGTAVDLSTAFQWYAMAANQDHPEAQYNVGLMLLRGQGAIRDIIAGIQWLKRAGALGHGEAYHAIGILFYGDLPSIPQHLDSSRLYFYKAIENNYRPAAINLGIMHADGLGGDKDLVKALALLRWSESGDLFIQNKMKTIEQQLSKPQVEKSDILYLALKGQQFATLLK